MENDHNTVKLGEGISDAVKLTANDRSSELAVKLTNRFFDNIIQMIDSPEATAVINKARKAIIEVFITHLKNKSEQTREIMRMWSNELFRQGLIPYGYAGLSDELLIHNFHQDGYLSGLYAGYALALVAMADKGAQKETIIEVRDAMRPNLFGHSYENRSEFCDLLKSEKYDWINKEKIHL